MGSILHQTNFKDSVNIGPQVASLELSLAGTGALPSAAIELTTARRWADFLKNPISFRR